ncbi:MAG TPA: ABC transporter substrate-binding protein [Mycobacteriales bacterium]|nr:ABC transporter substrate-binding protein [Mycobacteriales bacterium]
MTAPVHRAVALLLLSASLAGCIQGGGGSGPDTVLVFVSAPLTRSPWVGEFLERGARLAAEQINAAGGIEVGDERRDVELVIRDHAGSAQTAQAHARDAVADGAAMLITDGVGALSVAQITGPASLPTVVTFDGSTSLIDEDRRPTLYRMAPANRPMTMRLSDYLADKAKRVAVLHDDTAYGKDGESDLAAAFERNRTPVARTVEIPAGATDVGPQVLAARRAGADTLVVWAAAPVVTAVVRAARSSGWSVPVYAGPTGEDPLVRQQLADRPEWVDGLTFVSFRITAEVGPEPWDAFRAAYEKRFGVDEVGVSADGKPVVQPPDWAMYPYDAIRLLKAALERADATGPPLIEALNTVFITGANGDERSFGPQNHEGVSQDDMYFGRFRRMRFYPVADDILSENLPPVPQ